MVRGALRSDLILLDRDAELLAENSQTSWWRTGFGVIGIAEVTEDATTRGLADLTHAAYALLDFLPETRLPAQDLWNLTLVLAVPWSFEEVVREPGLLEALEAVAHDPTGARKIVLWSNETLRDHFGRLATAAEKVQGFNWNDPLREAIDTASRDEEERRSLEVLFKRKLGQDDIDALVRVLGREK
jgi:hypothetical protein